jgi:integrase
MSVTLKYAYLKHQTWLYRRNYPKHLQPLLGQALKRSLKTADARTARARVMEVNQTYASIVAQADATLKATPFTDQITTITVSPPKLERFHIQGQTTVKALGQAYLSQRSKDLKPGSYKSVRFSLGLFVSVFGTKRVGDLCPANGQEFLVLLSRLSPDIAKSPALKSTGLRELVALSEGAKRTIAPQTQHRIWTQVCHFLDWAVRENHVTQHDFCKLAVDAKPDVKSYAVMTEAEVVALLAANDPLLTPLLRLCLLTGMRSGEACGLLGEDLTTKGNLGVFAQIRPNRIRGLKSKAAEREVPLHDSLLGIATALGSDGPLFPDLTVDRVTKRFATLRQRAEITRPGLVFHSTRKWFITQCERTGVPEHFTASLVGHQSARSANRLTYGLYSAGISDAQKREIVDQVRLPLGVA